MAKYFDSINLALLVVLGGLCLFQWSRERDYGRQLVELRQTASHQADQLGVQKEAIDHAHEDLEDFKKEIVNFKAQADESNALIRLQKAQVFRLEEEKGRTARQLAQWQKALEDYKEAVAARDDNIKTLLAQRDQLVATNQDVAGKANEAVRAYNDLVSKYEDVVTRYNDLAGRYQSEHKAAADATN